MGGQYNSVNYGQLHWFFHIISGPSLIRPLIVSAFLYTTSPATSNFLLNTASGIEWPLYSYKT